MRSTHIQGVDGTDMSSTHTGSEEDVAMGSQRGAELVVMRSILAVEGVVMRIMLGMEGLLKR